MKPEEYEASLLKRLDIIINLLLENTEDTDDTKITAKILKLNKFGLKPYEIGNIIGKTSNYISSSINMANKKKKKGAKK